MLNIGNSINRPNSLNDNIIVHGWKIKSSKIIKTSTGSPLELYTLMKGKWILKCQIYISEETIYFLYFEYSFKYSF